jgi:hypothetical protein
MRLARHSRLGLLYGVFMVHPVNALVFLKFAVRVPLCTALYRYCTVLYRFDVQYFFNNPHLKAFIGHVYRFVPFVPVLKNGQPIRSLMFSRVKCKLSLHT